MEAIYAEESDTKPCFEIENSICRCCFSTDKKLINIAPLNSLFLDLVQIDINDDGLPPWLCNECYVLLMKSVRFKQQVHKAHNLWFDYINRCAPFSIDAQDSELKRYSLPLLKTTETLSISLDTSDHRTAHDCQVYSHKSSPTDSVLTVALPLEDEEERPLVLEDDLVKEESSFSDYEDNITLDAFKSAKSQNGDIAGSFDDSGMEIKQEPSEPKKRKKTKKTESKEKRKKKKTDTDDEPEPEKRKSVRGPPVEVDVEKVEVITLDPEEHMRQVKAEAERENLRFPFQCSLCHRGFNFQVKLDNHMSKHSPSRGRFTCTYCHMYFPSTFSQRVHMYTHTRRYKCRLCEKVVRDPVTIMQHVRSQHEGITDVFTCEICGKISNNSKTHRGHMRNAHFGARADCAICARSFVNLASLQEHLQIHEGVKNFTCSVCGKSFRTRTQVKYHQLAHSEVRRYYCVECDVRFKSAQSLKQHLERSSKHADKGSTRRAPAAAARLSCFCGRTLSSLRSLRRHTRAVHERAPPPPPKHRCAHCQRAFASKSVLQNHLRTHTGEKPFACALCGRRFAQRTAMRTHAKLVHRAAPAQASTAQPALPALTGAGVVKEETGVAWRGGESYFTVTAGP